MLPFVKTCRQVEARGQLRDRRDPDDSRRIEDLPEEVLLKIASYLSAADLLSFSHTCSKFFKWISTAEFLWHRKLTAENLTTDSPRLLKKAEGLEASFLVACLSKRIFLMRQKIRQNLRSGRLKKVSEINPCCGGQLVTSDDFVVYCNASFGHSGICLEIYRVETGQWSILEHRLKGRGGCWIPVQATITGKFLAVIYHWHVESLLASDDEEMAGGGAQLDYKIVVADIASHEPRILWSLNHNNGEYKFAESKIFRVKKAFGHGILDEIDFATGVTVNSCMFSNYGDGGEFAADDVFFYHSDAPKRALRVVNLTSANVDFTFEERPSAFFLPGRGSAPILVFSRGEFDRIRVVGRDRAEVFAFLPSLVLGNDVHICDVVGITEGSVTLSKRRVRLAPSLGQGVHQVGSVEAPFGHDFSFADPMTPIDGFDDDSDQIDGDEVLLIEGCIAWLRKTPGVSVEFVNIDNGNTKHRLEVAEAVGNNTYPSIHASSSVFAVYLEDQVHIYDLASFD